MKPICMPCQRFFRPSHNGLYFIEGMPTRTEAPPGNSDPDAWRPYKLWCGDVWACEGCGATIIVGTGQAPVAEHFVKDFDEQVRKACGDDEPPFQVNDC